MSKPTRPVLRYHGGKWMIAEWIISKLPPHSVYIEPFGGGFSVGMRKERVSHEVYNELSGEMVNLFRVYRDRGEELAEKVRRTPFSREDYKLSYELSEDPLEQARRTLARSCMGYGSNSLCRSIKSGFRAKSGRTSGMSAAADWMNLPDKMPALIARLRGVVIEGVKAEDLIRRHDGPEVLFYCDPPYLPKTRSVRMNGHHGYDHEMSEEDHVALAELLRAVKGKVALSGYPSELYERLYEGWERHERAGRVDSTGSLRHGTEMPERTEVLWCNYRLTAQETLF
jgi:DNA adenine methylase